MDRVQQAWLPPARWLMGGMLKEQGGWDKFGMERMAKLFWKWMSSATLQIRQNLRISLIRSEAKRVQEAWLHLKGLGWPKEFLERMA